MSLVSGFHHVTVCASGAQEDVDFLTQVFGQRLIKQTILFDGRYAHYHLYYSNAGAEPGSVYTTFPYKRVPGRPGSGQIQSTAYTVKKGATKFWDEHLTHHKVKHSGDSGAVRTEVHPVQPSLRFAAGSDRGFHRRSQALDGGRGHRRRRDAWVPRAGAFGSRDSGDRAVFRRSAGIQEDRRGGQLTIAWN